MNSTPPPGGQADDRPALDPVQLRARAELYLIEACGLPSHLLPSALDGGLRLVVTELRAMAQRRLRLVERLNTAAATVTAQAVEVLEMTGVGQAPPRGRAALEPRDVAAVDDLAARVLELDHQLTRWTAALVRAAAEGGVVEPAGPWAEQKSPPGR